MKERLAIGAPDKMESGRHGAGTPSGFVWLWGLLTAVWFAANSSLAIEALVTGALISGALAYVFTRNSGIWGDVQFSPLRLYHFVRYTGVFIVELVRSNIKMLRYVYAPRIVINPGIVRVRTNLKTPVGRLALANSIALTPGSLVMDMEGDSLFVHCLDVTTTDPDEGTRLIVGPFEEHLGKAFG